jgi:hypothetical protein
MISRLVLLLVFLPLTSPLSAPIPRRALPAFLAAPLLPLSLPAFADEPAAPASSPPALGPSIYDFSVPILNTNKPLSSVLPTPRPPAVLLVNIKQDDPLSRLNIPQMISLARRHPELYVVAVPSDQGYYEPDTSALLRLKLSSE